MRTIHKYTLPLTDFPEITMPMDAEVLSVAVQKGEIQVWATVTVSDEPPMVGRRLFRCAGTGHPIGDISNSRFLGTVILAGGDLVFHIFEIGHRV